MGNILTFNEAYMPIHYGTNRHITANRNTEDSITDVFEIFSVTASVVFITS